MTTVILDNITFRIEQGTIDVTQLREPDPEWCYQDKKGHIHVWRLVDGEPQVVASLVYIVDSPGTDEYPEIGHTECRRCGEHVDAGYRPVPYRVTAAGLRTFYINDEEVSEEKYAEIFNEVLKRCGS